MATAKKSSRKKTMVVRRTPSASVRKAGATAARKSAAGGARRAPAKAAVKRAAKRKVPAAAKHAVKRTPGPAAKRVVKSAGKSTAKRVTKRAAKATTAAFVLGDLPIEVTNLALVLDALHAETGSNGGDAAQVRVQHFRAQRGDVDAATFGFVSSLPIRHWYASAMERPNQEERRSLWFKVRELLRRPQVANPGGWDGASPADDLRLIAQRAAP